MLIRFLAVALALIPVSALAQQQAPPEIQAASQMLQQAQAQEFALRVEVAKLQALLAQNRAEHKVKPDDLPRPKAPVTIEPAPAPKPEATTVPRLDKKQVEKP